MSYRLNSLLLYLPAVAIGGCSDDPASGPYQFSDTTGGNVTTTAQSSVTGGTLTGGTLTGGTLTGGTLTGGTLTGGTLTGGTLTGGTLTGGTLTGGTLTGGTLTGGTLTGGTLTGGTATGGTLTGGTLTGGTLTGGTLTGGTLTGGTLTGGVATGTDSGVSVVTGAATTDTQTASGSGGATSSAETASVASSSSSTTATSGDASASTTTATGSGTGGATSSAATVSTTGSAGTGGTPNPDPGCGSHKWACWPMPNPANSGLPNPASYTDNGDGTVLDNVTGLVWQQTQPGGTYNWNAAIAYCEGLSLGGQSDWRIPTRIEIMSVLDYSKSGSKWAGEAFPGASGGFHHTGSDWILTITQEGAGEGGDYAWAFNMSDGIVSNYYSKSNSTAVRCVRGGGSGEGPSEPAVAPPNQYTLVSTEEARDNYTGLIWQRGDSDSMLSWAEAVTYCQGLNLNGHSWRLPTIREISTLVDEALVAPSINVDMFPNTQYGARSNNWYWASHQQGSAAWGLNFDDGFTGFNSGSAAWNTFGPSWARCVR